MKTTALLIFLCLLCGCLCCAEVDFKKWGIEPGSAVFPDKDTGYALQFKDGKNNILKTTDSGKTWRVCRYGRTIMDHDDAAPEGESPGPENICRLYFVDADNGFAYGGGQISAPIFLATRDGGATWDEAEGDRLDRIVGDGIQGMHMFSSREGFIQNLCWMVKTVDGWRSAEVIYPSGEKDIRQYGWFVMGMFCFRDINRGFLVLEKGVLYTEDGAKNWRLVLSIDGYQIEKIVREESGIILAGKNRSYLSTDFGATWEQRD